MMNKRFDAWVVCMLKHGFGGVPIIYIPINVAHPKDQTPKLGLVLLLELLFKVL